MKEKRRILGVDPGTYKSGYCLFDFDNMRIHEMGHLDNECVLVYIRECMAKKMVDYVVVESIVLRFKVGGSVYETCKMIGRIQEVAFSFGVPFEEVPRTDINDYFTGNTNCTKGDVNAELRKKFGEKGTIKNPGILYGVTAHAWDAVALCVWHDCGSIRRPRPWKEKLNSSGDSLLSEQGTKVGSV